MLQYRCRLPVLAQVYTVDQYRSPAVPHMVTMLSHSCISILDTQSLCCTTRQPWNVKRRSPGRRRCSWTASVHSYADRSRACKKPFWRRRRPGKTTERLWVDSLNWFVPYYTTLLLTGHT